MRKSLIIFTLVLGLVAGAAGVSASPAAAWFYDLGVKTVSFHEADDACIDGLFACTPNAGDGMANVIQVRQVDTGDGYVFGDIGTTSVFGDDYIWLAATLGAECRSGYRLDRASIVSGWHYEHGSSKNPVEVHPWYLPISVPNAKTMPSKLLAINLPVERAFGEDGQAPIIQGFPSLASLYGYGEIAVHNRMATGMSEAEARSQSFTVDAHVNLSAEVWCRPLGAGADRYKTMPRMIPITVEYVGVPVPPAKVQAGGGGGGLTVAPRVTDVDLTVTPVPNSCELTLQLFLRSDRPVTAYYRIIDRFGQRSNAFAVELDGQSTTGRFHVVPYPDADPTPDGPSLVAPTGPGEIGGYATEDIGRLTGTFRIEVYSPNLIHSDVVGFNVEPCQPPVGVEGPGSAPEPPSPQSPTHAGGLVEAGGSTPTPTPPPRPSGPIGSLSLG